MSPDTHLKSLYSRMLQASGGEVPDKHMIIYMFGLLENHPESYDKLTERGEKGIGFKIYYKLNMKSRKKPLVTNLISCELRGLTVQDDGDTYTFGLHWSNVVGIDIHESLKP